MPELETGEEGLDLQNAHTNLLNAEQAVEDLEAALLKARAVLATARKKLGGLLDNLGKDPNELNYDNLGPLPSGPLPSGSHRSMEPSSMKPSVIGPNDVIDAVLKRNDDRGKAYDGRGKASARSVGQAVNELQNEGKLKPASEEACSFKDGKYEVNLAAVARDIPDGCSKILLPRKNSKGEPVMTGGDPNVQVCDIIEFKVGPDGKVITNAAGEAIVSKKHIFDPQEGADIVYKQQPAQAQQQAMGFAQQVPREERNPFGSSHHSARGSRGGSARSNGYMEVEPPDDGYIAVMPAPQQAQGALPVLPARSSVLDRAANLHDNVVYDFASPSPVYDKVVQKSADNAYDVVSGPAPAAPDYLVPRFGNTPPPQTMAPAPQQPDQGYETLQPKPRPAGQTMAPAPQPEPVYATIPDKYADPQRNPSVAAKMSQGSQGPENKGPAGPAYAGRDDHAKLAGSIKSSLTAHTNKGPTSQHGGNSTPNATPNVASQKSAGGRIGG